MVKCISCLGLVQLHLDRGHTAKVKRLYMYVHTVWGMNSPSTLERLDKGGRVLPWDPITERVLDTSSGPGFSVGIEVS